LARHEDCGQPEKPRYSFEDVESGKIVPNPGWLREVWGKWPGDESIEELLAAPDGDSLKNPIGDEQKRWNRHLNRKLEKHLWC